MPTYEYGCTKCNHEFEDLLKMDDRDLPINQPCPNCKEVGSVQHEMRSAPSLVSPFSISGLKKPQPDFKERMNQIKKGMKNTSAAKHIKEY